MLRDICLVLAGALGAIVVEGGVLVVVVAVMWRRHFHELNR